MKKNYSISHKLKWILTIVFYITGLNVHGQESVLHLEKMDSVYSEVLSKSYKERNKTFLDELKKETSDKKLYNYYEKKFEGFFKELNEDIVAGQMINVPVVSDKVKTVLSEVKNKNGLSEELNIMLLRNNEANAFTVGENTIFLNIGLFYYLDNEAQLAAILSHEISHLILEHTMSVLKRSYYKKEEDEDNLKSIRSVKVNKSEKAFDYVKNSIYKTEKEKREHELQADSLRFLLFSKTKYEKREFVNALRIIEVYDTLRPSGLETATFKKLFDLPQQKFKDDWLEAEDFSSYNYNAYTEKFDKDSLASHPKTNDRVSHLAEIFPELQLDDSLETSDKNLGELKSIIKHEQIPNLFFNEQYGDVAYISMLNLQSDLNSEYYKNWLGKAFHKIHKARKDYKLNKYLERINPKEQSKSYMQFLSFVWNLKTEELKAIANHYYPKANEDLN